jgi:hypothetical protein
MFLCEIHTMKFLCEEAIDPTFRLSPALWLTEMVSVVLSISEDGLSWSCQNPDIVSLV